MLHSFRKLFFSESSLPWGAILDFKFSYLSPFNFSLYIVWVRMVFADVCTVDRRINFIFFKNICSSFLYALTIFSWSNS